LTHYFYRLNEKKKIVIVGPAYPYRGGNALYVSFLYDVLKVKFEVEIVNYKLLYPSILFPGTTQNDISGFVIKESISKRIINSVNPFTWIKAAKHINNLKADLVYFDWWNPFFGPSHRVISSLIKKQYRNRIIFITENVMSHEGRFIDRVLTKMGLKNANAFIALSNIVEDALKDFTDKKIYKSALPIYGGYNLDKNLDVSKQKVEFGFKEDDDVLLFFGYVRKYKGLNVLLDAMPEIIKKNSKAKLLIVGEFYDSPDKYYEQINNLGIKDNVKVVQRFVPNEEVGKYYSIADLVILPYLSATQSGVLNIAYGFGKPVIVTDVGGLAEDVIDGKTGYIINPKDENAIIMAVERFFGDRGKIDFETNINNKLEDNLFNKFPELTEQILKERE
jgi:glycosyltransferase involved in cell wall biosynthesis